MNIEQTFEVECIEPKKHLTKGKKYQVKQSKYENMYELIDDTGHFGSYFKRRFKVVENKKTWLERFYEEKGKEIIEEIIKEVVEGEKVEEVIKVRCIKEMNFKDITEGKEYTVVEEEPQGYKIINDAESIRRYHKDLFEKVTDDVPIVECIDNKRYEENLTLNKKYKVLEEDENNYFIKDNLFNRVIGFSKSRFKPVEPQKEEKKEYTFKEVIENIKDGEIYKYSDTIIKQVDGAISVGKEKAFSDGETLGFWFYNMYKFTKVEEPKPVTTSEAMKALEEGKEIESTYTGDKYKKENGLLVIQGKGFNNYCKCGSIAASELTNSWIILE